MAKKKYVPTPQDRTDSVRFVIYELWMLRECAEMPKPGPRVIRNIWYESLALHTRVLRDFFFTKVNDKRKRATHDSDIVAVDYFTVGASSWPYTWADLPPYLKGNKDRMDWALAHLSFGRLNYSGDDKEWEAKIMLAEIDEKWFEFLDKLKTLNEPAAALFIGQAQRRKLPISAA
jgi:hypothetical protein